MHQTTGEEVKFKADEVLYFALLNPTSDIYGESPLELVLDEAGINLKVLRANKAIFRNGMNPSAALLRVIHLSKLRYSDDPGIPL